MRPFLLAFSVWLAAFLIGGAGLILGTRSDEIAGDVVLESAPYCDFYVVKTPQAYVYLSSFPPEIVSLAGSTRIRGRLLIPGAQTVRLDERVAIKMTVVGSATEWEAAKLRFAAECGTPNLPAEFLRNPP
jgi:hypothetical protein